MRASAYQPTSNPLIYAGQGRTDAVPPADEEPAGGHTAQHTPYRTDSAVRGKQRRHPTLSTLHKATARDPMIRTTACLNHASGHPSPLVIKPAEALRNRLGFERNFATQPDGASGKSAKVSNRSATAAHRRPHRGAAARPRPRRQRGRPPSSKRSTAGGIARPCPTRLRHQHAGIPAGQRTLPRGFNGTGAAPAPAGGRRHTPSPRRSGGLPSSPDAPVRSPPGTARSSSRT